MNIMKLDKKIIAASVSGLFCILVSSQTHAQESANILRYANKTSNVTISSGVVGVSIDARGFNNDGIHQETNTQYDARGFDVNGIHQTTGTGYNAQNFDVSGNHVDTGTQYDTLGYDEDGYDQSGYTAFSCTIDIFRSYFVQYNGTTQVHAYYWDSELIGVRYNHYEQVTGSDGTIYGAGRTGGTSGTKWICYKTLKV
jgi:hypothetical protein